MRSDGLTNTKYSDHNRLMFISQEREVQDMYDLEQQPDLEVFVETSITSSSYSGSICVPPSSVQCEGERDGTNPLKSPPLFRLKPNRRKPDADEHPQLTTKMSSSKARLSISDFSNRRLSRLSLFSTPSNLPSVSNSSSLILLSV